MKLAPITLFAYKRPDHLRRTIESLVRNYLAEESHLIVFSDGCRSGEDRPAVEEVRRYLATIREFAQVTVVEREQNLGLANSVIKGVSEVISHYGRTIVLEDDMLCSPHFLRFMNEGLSRYVDDDRVISIHGYLYPVSALLPTTFFLRGADCWGWGTWERGWRLFESNGQRLLNALEAGGRQHDFDFEGTFLYTKMLKEQIAGRIDSWAVRWYASAFVADKLTLYPGRSLIRNIGMDASGTHCRDTSEYSSDLAMEPIAVEDISVEENGEARRAFSRYFRALRPSLSHRIVRVATDVLGRMNR